MVDLAVRIRDRLSPDTLSIANLVGFNFLAVAQYVAGDQSFLRASQMSDPDHDSRPDGHAEVIRVVDSVASSDGFDRIIEAMHNSDPTATDPLAGKAAIIARFPATLTHGDHFPIAAMGSHLESVEAIRALMIQPSSVPLQQMLQHDDTHAGGLAARHSTPSSSISQSEHSSLKQASSDYGTDNSHKPEEHGLGTADHVPDQTTNHGVSASNLSSDSAVLLTTGSMFDNFETIDHSVQDAAHVDRTSPNDMPGSVFAGSSTSFSNNLRTITPLQTSAQTSHVGFSPSYQGTDNDSSTGYSLSLADQTNVSTSDSSTVSKSSYPLSPTSTGASELLSGISGDLGSTVGLNTSVTLSAIEPTPMTPVDDHDPDVQKVSHTEPVSVPPVAVSSAGSGSSSEGGDGHSGVGTVSGLTVDPTGGGSSSTSGTVGATVTGPVTGAGGSGISGGVVPPIGSSDGSITSVGGVSGVGTTGSVGSTTAPPHVDGGAGDQSSGAQVGGTHFGGSSTSTGTGTGTGSPSGTVAGASGGVSGSVADHHAGDTGGGQVGTGAGSGSSSEGGDGHSGVDAGAGLLQGDALAQLRDSLLKQISGLLAWHSQYTTGTAQTTGSVSSITTNSPTIIQQAPGNGDSGNPLVAHTVPDTPHIDGGSLAQERADLMRLHDTLMQQAFGAEAKTQASVTYVPQASAKSAVFSQPAAAMMAAAPSRLDAHFEDEQSPTARSELHDPASSPIHHGNPQEHHQTNQDLHSHSYDDAHHLGSHSPYYDHF